MSHATDERPAAAGNPTAAARLAIVAEQLRLTAVALDAMSRITPKGGAHIDRHAARLDARAGELMRAVSRLSRDLGTVDAWGLHILFEEPGAPPAPSRPPAAARPDDSLELEPIEWLPRLGPPRLPPRVAPATRWTDAPVEAVARLPEPLLRAC